MHGLHRRVSHWGHGLYRTGVAFLFLALSGVPLSGQNSNDAGYLEADEAIVRPTLSAAPLSGSIVLDGRLDDLAWQDAQVATGFIQGTPVEGVPAEEETEIRVVFGPDAIYVAARMFESDPASIDRRLVRRDQEGTYDYVSVSLDPNLDHRTGYYFRVSAANVQVDQYYHGDQRLDRNWNAVWESSVQIDELGWTAELKIPLSQIRYEANDDVQTWESTSPERG